jgi:type II secretory pathway component HofQ
MIGGLEEESTNETGSGTPFLSRIPIIKWFFSSRTKAKSKSKLTIFIKPTVIY